MADHIFITCPSCGVKNRVPVDRIPDGPRCGRCKAPLPAGSAASVHTVTDADFDRFVSSDKPVLVDCWAPWCGPCRMIGPIVQEIAREFAGKALVGKLNVDENPATASRYGIRSIPTILLFKNGQLVDTIVGAVPKERIAAALSALV